LNVTVIAQPSIWRRPVKYSIALTIWLSVVMKPKKALQQLCCKALEACRLPNISAVRFQDVPSSDSQETYSPPHAENSSALPVLILNMRLDDTAVELQAT